MDFENLHCTLQESVIKFLASGNSGHPTLLFSNELLKKNVEFFLGCINVDKIYYPVKTNNRIEVLEFLKKTGINFEIASLGELQLLLGMGAHSDAILFGNPIKLDEHIQAAAQAGVTTFAVDTESELHKIACYTKNANIYLRLDVPNDGAAWSLSNKFGCNAEEAVVLFKEAINLSMKPAGVSFHVGWNNANVDTWRGALEMAYQTIKQCWDNQIALKFVNLGGGFPAHLNDQYRDLTAIATVINPYLDKIKQEFNMEIFAEPGSFFTANAGIVVAKVVDVVRRKDKLWVYLNTGTNQGFSWIMGGVKYDIFSPEKVTSPLQEYILCGPTCDSHDVFGYQILLSNTLKRGDVLLIYPAGAYISSAKTYNGFDYPTFTAC